MNDREAEFRANVQALDPGWYFEIRDSESGELLAAGTREAFADATLDLARQLDVARQEGKGKQGWDIIWQKEPE